MDRMTRSFYLAFSTGYHDCATCLGAGVVFTSDTAIGCPECTARDRAFEEVYGLGNDSHLSS